MKKLGFAILILSASFVVAQDNANNTQPASKDSNGQVTVQGCVSRSNGDYTLMKQDPAVTYELQGSHKIKLHHYLGQRVEVTGNQAPSMSTSSDSMARMGSAAPVTLTITSIRTLDKDCSARDVNR
ncbi:MAG: hypothetical protein WBX38_18825 [Candidatus Sulfotelmatobacter sp.]